MDKIALYPTHSTVQVAGMDEIDRLILSALRRDARLPVAALAAEAGIARATARARLARLIASGEIEGFTAITRGDRADSPVRGLMMLAVEGAGTDRLIHRLLGMSEMRKVHSTNGRWDLIAEIGTATLADFDRVLGEVRRLPGVVSSETSLLLTTRRGGTR